MDGTAILNFITVSVLPIAWHILLVILIYLVGSKLISTGLSLLKKALEKTRLEEGVITFLCSLCRIALYVIMVFAICNVFGIATATIVALLGSVGLTVGLALQGSLSNLAGGVLILVLKPYRVGDYIVTCGEQGTVAGIDIFYTTLSTTDNRKIVIPNGSIMNSNIVNVSFEPYRRVDLVFPVSYKSDIKKVKEVLAKLAEGNEMIEQDEAHPVNIYVDEFADSSINFGFRVWTKAENYWKLRWQLMEDVKAAFDENGIEIPFNQLDVTIKQ